MLEANIPKSNDQETRLNPGFKGRLMDFIKDPEIIKLHALMQRSDFKSDMSWIATELSMDIDKVRNNISKMCELQIVDYSDGKMTLLQEDISLQNHYLDDNSKHLEAIRGHMLLSSEVMNNFNMESRFCFQNGVLATDDKSARKFHDGFLKLIKEYIEDSKKGPKNILMGYQMTATNMCTSKGGQ